MPPKQKRFEHKARVVHVVHAKSQANDEEEIKKLLRDMEKSLNKKSDDGENDEPEDTKPTAAPQKDMKKVTEVLSNDKEPIEEQGKIFRRFLIWQKPLLK